MFDKPYRRGSSLFGTAFFMLFRTFAAEKENGMKRIGIYIIGMTLAVLLASCMGESGYWETYGAQAGVVRLVPEKIIRLRDGSGITSEAFQNQAAEEGDCCLVDFRLNWGDLDHKEQQEWAEEKEIHDATIVSYTPVPRWELLTVPDTAEVRRDETFPTVDPESSLYVDGYLFLFPEYNRYYLSQVNAYTFSYNPEAEPIVDEMTGLRGFELYVRSRATWIAGDTAIRRNWSVPQAIDIADLVEQARAKGYASGDSLNIRFVYPTSFSPDSTEYTWETSDMHTVMLKYRPDNL